MNLLSGIILANNQRSDMRDLTKDRTTSSVPFGGRYRLIDFSLSNFVKAGVKEVAVATRSSYYSLMNHLGSGKEWDLDRKKGGLFLFPPSLENSIHSTDISNSTMAGLQNAITFIGKSENEYVIVTDGTIIGNLDYNQLLEFHIEKQAYMTVVYNRAHPSSKSSFGKTVLHIDDHSRVTSTTITSEFADGSPTYIGIFIMRRSDLEILVNQCVAQNKMNFEKDVIQAKANESAIYAYNFDGYSEKIETVENYLKVSMDLLDRDIRNEVFANNVITKIRSDAPTKYGNNSKVRNSLIADGCEIDGEVENSIVFKGARIATGAVVKNSIIFPDTQVLHNSNLEHCIVDKNSTISEGRTIIGVENYPTLLGKGVRV